MIPRASAMAATTRLKTTPGAIKTAQHRPGKRVFKEGGDGERQNKRFRINYKRLIIKQFQHAVRAIWLSD
jgi:hypothetical protein